MHNSLSSNIQRNWHHIHATEVFSRVGWASRFYANIKLQYPSSASDSFSLLLFLLAPHYWLCDVVGDVHNLLVCRVYAESQHRPVKILFKRLKLHKLTELTHCSSDNEAHFREDCPLSKPSLQGLKHAGHVVQLLAGELLRVVDDVIVHLESEKG